MERDSFLPDSLLPFLMYLDMALLGVLPLMIFIASLITGARSLQVGSLWYSPWYPNLGLITCGVGAASAPLTYIAIFFVARKGLQTHEAKWLLALLTIIVVDCVSAILGLLYWQRESLAGAAMTNPILMQSRLIFSIMIIAANLAIMWPIIMQRDTEGRP